MATTHIPVHVTLEVDWTDTIEALGVMADAAEELRVAQVARQRTREASANRDGESATVAACDDDHDSADRGARP